MQRALDQRMPGVRDHTELDVWKLSNLVRLKVRILVARPIFQRDWDLRDQLSEAAESPCPNIGEGFSRYLPRDFARFVRIAKGSLTEVIEHMGRALAKGFVNEDETNEVCTLARRARGAATNLIIYLESAEAPGFRRKRSPPKPTRRRKRRPPRRPSP